MNNYSIILKLISIFSKGDFYSIDQLSIMLSLENYIILHNINLIKNFSIKINFLPEKGYGLLNPIELLDKKIILKYLNYNNLIFIPIINSTNQYLLDNIEKIKSGDVCIAEYQSHGRGRFGKLWDSPFGVNLYISIYWVFKNKSFIIQNGLSLMIGIVIAKILKKIGVHNVKIKWPNDIYVGDKKISGILIELVKKINIKAIIGIGININMSSNKSLIYQSKPRISLKEIGLNVHRNKLAAIIINKIRESIPIFAKYGLTPFIKKWLTLDMFLDKKITLYINKTNLVFGIGRGIDTNGRLLIEYNFKIQAFSLGTIILNSNN